MAASGGRDRYLSLEDALRDAREALCALDRAIVEVTGLDALVRAWLEALRRAQELAAAGLGDEELPGDDPGE